MRRVAILLGCLAAACGPADHVAQTTDETWTTSGDEDGEATPPPDPADDPAGEADEADEPQ